MWRPLLVLSLAFGLGCSIDGLATRQAALLSFLAAALLVLAPVTARGAWAMGALAAAAGALGGAAATAERAAHEAAPLLRAVDPTAGRPLRLVGRLAGDPRDLGDRLGLVVDVETIEGEGGVRAAPGRVRLTVGGDARRPEMLAGDRVAVWATLRPPRGYGNPGSADVEGAARRAGIHFYGYCKSSRLLQRLPAERWSLARGLALARRWSRGVLGRHVPPGPEEGLVRAMVLGDRAGIDDETSEALRVAGTYHVVAISGAQVALLAGLLLLFMRRLAAGPLVGAVVVSGTVTLYALLVGGEPPVARAALMAAVLLLGRALDLDADLANLAGLAGMILLLWRPSTVGDVGFQLSFAATLGILLLTPALLGRLRPLPLGIHLVLAVSLAAQLPLVPLLAFHFHRLAPAALVMNLVAAPLASVVLLAGLAVLLASVAAPFLAGLAGAVAWIAAHVLLRSGELVQGAPFLDVRVPTPPLWAVATYVTGLVVLPGPRASRKGWLLVGLGLAGLVAATPAPADGRLHVTVLDVGQGDSILVRSPAGRSLLVDAGDARDGGFDVGERVVAPALWAEGHRRLDRLIVTHAHPDHAGGVPFLVRTFRPADVWEGPSPRGDPSYRALDRALASSGVGRRTVFAGIRETWDEVDLEVWGPRPPDRAPWRTRNDDSVVIAVSLGAVRILLTGDIEGAGERRLAGTGIGAAVLKVPHHGSRTSSTPEFLARVSPRIAVVSVGYRSRFGHPHAEVVARYEALGVRVLRTDRDGAVTVATDGARAWLRTFLGARWEPIH